MEEWDTTLPGWKVAPLRPWRHLWVMVGHLWCGSYSWPILSMFQDFENCLPLHTKSEMQDHQPTSTGPSLQAKKWVGSWSAHNLLNCCVCVLPSPRVCQGKAECVRMWSVRAQRSRARHFHSKFHKKLAQLACFKYSPKIYFSSYSQLFGPKKYRNNLSNLTLDGIKYPLSTKVNRELVRSWC